MTDKDPKWLKDGRKDKETFDRELKKTGDTGKAIQKVEKQVQKDKKERGN